MIDKLVFEDYANYTNGSAPLRTLSIFENAYTSEAGTLLDASKFGAVTSTVSLDNATVAKFTKLIGLNRDYEVSAYPTAESVAALTRRRDIAEDLVVPEHIMTELAMRNKDAVDEAIASRLLLLGEKRASLYELLHSYLGGYLPEFKLYGVVNSPRRELERLRAKKIYNIDLSVETLSRVPQWEITLMELWENVDATADLQLATFAQLHQLYSSASVRASFSHFATCAYRLLREEHILLDMCDFADMGGIRLRVEPSLGDSPGKLRTKIGNACDILNPISTYIPFPRNITYRDDVLKFYDITPVKKLPDDVYLYVPHLVEAMCSEDMGALSNILEYAQSRHPSIVTVCSTYIALLKFLGADFN